MKRYSLALVLLLIASLFISCTEQKSQSVNYGIVIHGGAGTITKEGLAEEKEKAYEEKLSEALTAGNDILANGGSALDAVEKAINIMEDSPLFNSAKGAVFTSNGMNELDASIMDGKTLNAGAVARIKHIKNPISLARLVMTDSKHVMLVGDGAEKFAMQQGIDTVSQDYFYTEDRWKSLQRAKEREAENEQSYHGESLEDKFGTVGAAALDKDGNLAAGTSTGGMTNKKYGRVGDSPIIGAGTYADNETCAVSGTGWGEYFIRLGVAFDIAKMMEYRGLPLKTAADEVVKEKLVKLGGHGGVIAIDKNGNIAMPFTTAGMFRAYHLEGEEPVVKMYKE